MGFYLAAPIVAHAPLCSTGLRAIKLNLKHGYSKAMPCAIAMYGAILARTGLVTLTEAGKWSLQINTTLIDLLRSSKSAETFTAKYGEIALALQDKHELNEHVAHVAHLAWGVLFSHTKKLSDCTKPLQAGFDAGIKSGKLFWKLPCECCLGIITDVPHLF